MALKINALWWQRILGRLNRRPRPPTEIELWNAEVERRKLDKKARKS